jgi:cysteine desulfuration protein SufE
MTDTLAAETAELASDFTTASVRERLDLLLEFSDNLPGLPRKYTDHPDLLERVEECQAPVYLFVEVENGIVATYFTAPEEAPTTRGFAGILHELLNNKTSTEVLSFPEDFPDTLGLAEAVSPLRLRGMRAMLARLKRQVREKS